MWVFLYHHAIQIQRVDNVTVTSDNGTFKVNVAPTLIITAYQPARSPIDLPDTQREEISFVHLSDGGECITPYHSRGGEAVSAATLQDLQACEYLYHDFTHRQ